MLLDKAIPVYARDRVLSAVWCKESSTWVREPGIRVDVMGEAGYEMVYCPVVWRDDQHYDMLLYASRYDPVSGVRSAGVARGESKDGLSWQIGTDYYSKGIPCGLYRDSHGTMRAVTKDTADASVGWVRSLGDADSILGSLSVEGSLQYMDAELCISKTTANRFNIYESGIGQLRQLNVVDLGTSGGYWESLRLQTVGQERVYTAMYTARSAWGMEIYTGTWCYSGSEVRLSEPRKALDYTGPYEKGGVRDPYIVRTGETKRLYYAGFWGIHLLMPLTHFAWRKAEHKQRDL